MIQRFRNVGIAGLFFAVLSFSLFSLGNTVHALAPGCYTKGQAQNSQGTTGNATPGWATKPCQDLVTVFPDFTVAPEDCYFTWETELGPSTPVKYKCEEPPSFSAAVVKPKDGKPGNGPEGPQDIEADPTFNSTQCNGKEVTSSDNCIIENINVAINILSGSIGLLVIIVIIIAGIQYTTAAGDPQRIGKAKNRIRNAIIALVAYMFLYGFLQWVIPGGL